MVSASVVFWLSSAVAAFGSATLIDGDATISGAATIMMTSSTRVMSTSGVTLMLANIPPSSRSAEAAI